MSAVPKRSWRNSLVSLLTAVCMVLLFLAIDRLFIEADESGGQFAVGFVYDGDESTPYTRNFLLAQRGLERKFGRSVKVIALSNVPTDEGTQALERLVSSGCRIIFTTSFGFKDAAKEMAQRHPEIHFCAATGDNSDSPVLKNYHTFMGEIHEGRYVSGIVAGLKIRELLDGGRIPEDGAKVGYVAAFPLPEVISGFTAFLLGVRSVVPGATMEVCYANSWNNYTAEMRCAKALIESGCAVISQHSDSIAPAVACEDAHSRANSETPIFHVGYNQCMTDVAPATSLSSVRINWAPYIEGAVEAVMRGRKIEGFVSGHVHRNDIGAGFDEDWVQVLELNETAAAAGTREKVEEAVEGLRNGRISVFSGEYTGRNPLDGDDTCDLREEFVECERQSAPTFRYLLDGIVRVID